jgi:hypothetical protein
MLPAIAMPSEFRFRLAFPPRSLIQSRSPYLSSFAGMRARMVRSRSAKFRIGLPSIPQ